MNPTETVAKSPGLTLERVGESTYLIRVGRQPEMSLLLSPFVICLGIVGVVFGGLATTFLIKSWGHAIGEGIGMFLSFGFLASLGGAAAILGWQLALILWHGQVLEIDLQQEIVTVLRGNRPRRTIPLSAIEAVELRPSAGRGGDPYVVILSVRVRTPTRDVVFQGHEDFCIRGQRLGYPMSTQLAEIKNVGRSIAQVLDVPFTNSIESP